MNKGSFRSARLNTPLFAVIAGIASFSLIFFSGCSSADTVTASGIATGVRAPEIVAPAASGKMMSLHDHTGAIVLVEFWDSGNHEARKNHFEMQRLYAKYKNANFKEGDQFCIFSVSLDTDREKWLKAVEEDNISWPCQTIDTKGWNALAATSFDVHYTPKYFLVGSDGKILDKHVNISELEEMLQDQLDKRQSRP